MASNQRCDKRSEIKKDYLLFRNNVGAFVKEQLAIENYEPLVGFEKAISYLGDYELFASELADRQTRFEFIGSQIKLINSVTLDDDWRAYRNLFKGDPWLANRPAGGDWESAHPMDKAFFCREHFERLHPDHDERRNFVVTFQENKDALGEGITSILKKIISNQRNNLDRGSREP